MLDEPANGVDPAGIRDLRALIRRLAGDGITVMLSSHLLAEVQEVCNRVAVINDGRIVHEGSLSELARTTAARYRLRTTDPERAAAASRRLDGLRELQSEGGELSFTLARDEDTVALTKLLADAGIGITSLVHEQATLEDLFFRLTEYEPGSPVTNEVAA
jgi:ABC-2 type transport system ATP-binding protein